MKRIEINPAVRHLISPHDQSADFVELFFDLVFVFAITKVTHMVAHHLDLKHAAQALLAFWLIWWAWTQFTWTLNAADTRRPEIRLATLVATAVAFVMAASTDLAFSAGALWFAVPYIVVRVLGLGIYFVIAGTMEGERRAVVVVAAISTIGFALVVIGALADPAVRVWWWLGTVVVDMIAVGVAGRFRSWNVRSEHFAERHGLIVIIALGESLIVSASAVGKADLAGDILWAGGLAVAVTCLLWWSYFGWISGRLEDRLTSAAEEDRGKMSRDVYTLPHFPLICGIIAVSIGFEKILGHPHDPLTAPIVATLAAGVLLFVGSTSTSVWFASRTPLVPRFAILALTMGAAFFAVGRPPVVALGLLAGGLLLVNIVEWEKCRNLIPMSEENA